MSFLASVIVRDNGDVWDIDPLRGCRPPAAADAGAKLFNPVHFNKRASNRFFVMDNAQGVVNVWAPVNR